MERDAVIDFLERHRQETKGIWSAPLELPDWDQQTIDAKRAELVSVKETETGLTVRNSGHRGCFPLFWIYS